MGLDPEFGIAQDLASIEPIEAFWANSRAKIMKNRVENLQND